MLKLLIDRVAIWGKWEFYQRALGFLYEVMTSDFSDIT
jgi:hypothetical protein